MLPRYQRRIENWRTLILAACAVTLTGAVASHAANAETDFSGKRIEIIVPFKEGGGTDRYTRFLAPNLKANLPGNPTIIIRNIPGANGIPGANQFQQRAEPDGLTLIATSATNTFTFILGKKGVNYKMNEWIPIIGTPIGKLIYVDPGLGVVTASDVKKLQDMKLVYGGNTPTSGDIHILLTLDLLGIEPNAVFGLSRGKARQGFERGEFNISYDTMPTYLKKIVPLVEKGKAVPLFTFGFTDSNGKYGRDPSLPDLPTFVEVYEQVHGKAPDGPGYEAWKTLYNAGIMSAKTLSLPAGTPKEIVDTYHAAIKKMVSAPDFAAKSEKAIGRYPNMLGDDAKKIVTNGTKLDPAVKKWLAAWVKRKYNVDL